MGCFSYMCKECGESIKSNVDDVTLSLLKEGKVIQSMRGLYDSYGRVYIDASKDALASHEWNDPFPDKPLDKYEQADVDNGDTTWTWSRVCDLVFSEGAGNGIAAVHTRCQVEGKEPTTMSDDDPNQGER